MNLRVNESISNKDINNYYNYYSAHQVKVGEAIMRVRNMNYHCVLITTVHSDIAWIT